MTPRATHRPAWRALPPREGAVGRVGHVVVVADGRLFVCGGRNQDGQALASVEVFDPRSGSWSSGPPLLSTRVNAAACFHNRRFYICGGEGNCEEALSTTEVLDLKNLQDGWQPGPVLKVARLGCTSAVYQGCLYIIGGTKSGGSRSRSWKSVEVLNLEDVSSGGIPSGHTTSKGADCKVGTLRHWEPGPELNVGRCFAAAALLGGLVYVAGGSEDGLAPLNSVEVLDRDGKSWGPGPKLAVGRIGPAGTVIENALYLSGGWSDKFQVLSSVEVLDPEVRQAWVPGPPMLVSRCHAAAGTVGVFA